MTSRLLAAAVLGVGLLGAGCNTYRDQLVRAQVTFEQNDHERTLALLRDMERDVHRLDRAEQARYAYLRGMTDYRIGYRGEARHWLALARTYEEASPGTLPNDWRLKTNQLLGELDVVVHTDGIAALSGQFRPGEDAPSPPVVAPSASEPPATE